MDIATITDVQQLKAMAFDQLMIQQQAENNLKLITQRIEQVLSEQQTAQESATRSTSKK